MASAPVLTFPRLLDQATAQFRDKVLLRRRHGGGGAPVTYRELHRDVRRLAQGLLDLGLRKGDRVALIADNCYEWLLADQACAYVGLVDVPRGCDTAPTELQQILTHSGCRIALCTEDRSIREIQSLQAELPELEGIYKLGAHSEVADIRCLPELLAEPGPDFDEHSEAVQPDDLLTIVYTSGTTADPKGVMLSHGNMGGNALATNEVLHIGPDDVLLSVLPAWHVYERIMDYLALICGGELVYTSRRAIKQDLMEISPTMFAAVPRIWESIHDGIMQHCARLEGLQKLILRDALAVCRAVGARQASALQRLRHRLYQRRILGKLRRALGTRMRIAVSGGGALPTHVDQTMLGIGVPLLNGYGLTETSPVVAVRPPQDNRAGTIGPTIPGTEVEVRDGAGRALPGGQTGVLFIRGPQVMSGYYRNEATTSKVLASDGWFNSGDLASIDADGHIRITGRAKDTIVLAGGENVEPEPIETGLKASTLIEQAVVLGQDQKGLSAILIPMPDLLEREIPKAEWEEQGGELRSEKLRTLFRAEIDRLITREGGFRPTDRITRFKLRSEPMTVENGLLTPTMKVKRHEVLKQWGGMIEDLMKS